MYIAALSPAANTNMVTKIFDLKLNLTSMSDPEEYVIYDAIVYRDNICLVASNQAVILISVIL